VASIRRPCDFADNNYEVPRMQNTQNLDSASFGLANSNVDLNEAAGAADAARVALSLVKKG